MATHFHSRAAVPPLHRRELKNPFFLLTKEIRRSSVHLQRNCDSTIRISRIKATNGGVESYLDMWRKAVERERKSIEFERMAGKNSLVDLGQEGKEASQEELERMNRDFEKLLEVPVEERDRVQRMQVIDRAAAAISAARALLEENSRPPQEVSGDDEVEGQQEGTRKDSPFQQQTPSTSGIGTPGPSFWAWAPPPLTDGDHIFIEAEIKRAQQLSPSPPRTVPVLEHERELNFLPIPFETSMLQNKNGPPIPPLQSLVEAEQVELTKSTQDELGVRFSAHAVEAANALSKVKESLNEGVDPDGSRWWKETGIERRPDGVMCKWTLTRGVSDDMGIEWENKYWEAADEFGYKELGSEKSGRDAAGNVWREYWRESMMQKAGLVHLEKTADKWGKNINGDEWQEKWWEHYGASGRVEKWAHKWCSIDPHTPVEAGHAHVWHERWGEKFDGQGGSVKYTDKWAKWGDGWAKWGDKWDEHFDSNGHGVKQGETWWEGKYGDRWNRTWGEGHNGSEWVHKYGRSSSGEHWDTHVQQKKKKRGTRGFRIMVSIIVSRTRSSYVMLRNHLIGREEKKKSVRWVVKGKKGKKNVSRTCGEGKKREKKLIFLMIWICMFVLKNKMLGLIISISSLLHIGIKQYTSLWFGHYRKKNSAVFQNQKYPLFLFYKLQVLH